MSKTIGLFISISLVFQTATSLANDLSATFGGKDCCFIQKELLTGKTVRRSHSDLCKERIYACSTFKVALAVMAFDSGIFINEESIIKWDGKKHEITAWNRDHDAKSWLSDSVVWVSQKLTPMLGLPKIHSYLKDFHYGNKDFSGGISHAWLSSTLKISPEEQVDFLTRLKLRKLNVKDDAVSNTLAIMPIEISKPNIRLIGKTGSGFSWEDEADKTDSPYRVGWYVGYFSKDSKDYVFATVFKENTQRGKRIFGGAEAKQITKAILENDAKK
ncbi:MAG: class D beta-lactamase [Deltaproteobacteria bacterium]|nr:class D beta-lactamase [Deltaproteobacteria bacterium]